LASGRDLGGQDITDPSFRFAIDDFVRHRVGEEQEIDENLWLVLFLVDVKRLGRHFQRGCVRDRLAGDSVCCRRGVGRGQDEGGGDEDGGDDEQGDQAGKPREAAVVNGRAAEQAGDPRD